MFKKNVLKLAVLLSFGTVGLAACQPSTSISTSVEMTAEQKAKVIFSSVGSSYGTLATTGISSDNEVTLIDSVVDYPEATISYSVDASKTEFKTAAASFKLGCQNLLNIDGNKLTIKAGEIDKTNHYAAFTATVTIDGQSFTNDYLVSVLETKTMKIANLVKNGKKGDVVQLRGIYMGHNPTVNSNLYNAVYIADGSDYMMLYKVSPDMLKGLEEGKSVVEVSGTYSPYNGLPEVGTITSIKTVTDSSIAAPKTIELAADTKLENANINARVHIADAVVESVNVGDYDNTTITFKIGETTVPYSLYLDSRYNDISSYKTLKKGDKLPTIYSFVGINSGKIQLTYAIPDAGAVTEVSISAKADQDIAFVGGYAVKLTAEVTAPAGADKTVSWTSSDEKIATVAVAEDGSVTVTGKAAGSVTLTATANADKTKTATVQLTVADPASQTIEAAKADLKKDHTSADGSNTAIKVKGYITKVVNSKYGNFYLNDADGKGVYVYGTNLGLDLVKEGASVEVRGIATLDTSYGLELVDAEVFTDADKTVTSSAPATYSTADSFNALGFVDAGDYVKITNVTSLNLDSRITLNLADGTISTNIKNTESALKGIAATPEAGKTYTITCYVSCYKAKVQLKDLISIVAE